MNSPEETLPLAVVLAQDDADDLLRAAPACRAVLALTPAARAALKAAPVPVLSSLPYYTATGHRRTILHQRRTIAELEAAFESAPALGPAAREALVIVLSYLTAASARLRTTLRGSGPGPWLIRQTGAWQHCDDPAAAFDLLFGRLVLARFDVTLKQKFGRPPLAGLAQGLATLAARAYRGRVPVVLGYGRRQLDRLAGRPAARDAVRTAAAVATGAAELTAGLARHLAALFAAAQPAALVTDSLGWGPGGAAGQAARERAVPVLFLSHSSHAAQTAPSARAAVNQWIRYGRVLSRFATTLLPKTPHAARAAEAARRPDLAAPAAPYVWLQSRRPPAEAGNGVFRMLHACNFSPWSEHVPWAMQTSDEFVQGIAVLGEVVEQTGNAHLVVRPKEKAECNADILQQLLPARRNVEYRRSGSFAQDLADSDLVVAYSSSTIEEALHLRIPVLLWGGGVDYRHLPAREAPPEGNSRAAVYAAASRAGLERMLPAIIAAHQGRPLRDEELADHLWPSGTPDWKALAGALADPGNEKIGSGISGI